MGLNTYPYNPFPASTDKLDEAHNEQIQAEIDQVKNDVTNLNNEIYGDSVTYPYADVITIPDAIPANVADCTVKIEPVQDLHGYDKPWIGGAGKNKLDYDDNTTGYFTSGCSATSIQNYVVSMTASASDMNIGNYNNASGLFAKSSCKAGDSYKIVVSDNSINKNYVTFLDDNNNVVSAVSVDLGSFSVPEGATKMGFRIGNGGAVSGTTYTTTVMVVNATETDATFAPYTNICPISGHTEASVQRDGVNLFPDTMTWELGSYGTAGNKINATDRARTVSGIKVLPNTRYTISFNSQHNFTRLCQYDSNGICINVSYSTTFTTLSNCASITITVGTTNDNIDVKCQLELGSTATSYVPYAGKTYTIALGDTIYGGTVDFDSGVMTVDRAIDTVGNLSFTKYDVAQGTLFRAGVSGIKIIQSYDVTTLLCSAYASSSSNDRVNGTISQLGNSEGIDIIDNRYSDADDFKTAMGSVQICYELATPTTIQLTPQQIQLLKGTNTFTASTGDISVTVNGVSAAIGSVQTQANNTDETLAELAADIAEQLPTAPTTDGAYVLTVTVESGTPTYSWESEE